MLLFSANTYTCVTKQKVYKAISLHFFFFFFFFAKTHCHWTNVINQSLKPQKDLHLKLHMCKSQGEYVSEKALKGAAKNLIKTLISQFKRGKQL